MRAWVAPRLLLPPPAAGRRRKRLTSIVDRTHPPLAPLSPELLVGRTRPVLSTSPRCQGIIACRRRRLLSSSDMRLSLPSSSANSCCQCTRCAAAAWRRVHSQQELVTLRLHQLRQAFNSFQHLVLDSSHLVHDPMIPDVFGGEHDCNTLNFDKL